MRAGRGSKSVRRGVLAATFEPNLTCDNVSFRKEPPPLKITSALPKFLLAGLRIYCGVPAKLVVTLRPEKPLRTALPSSKSLLADWAVPQSVIFGYHSGQFEEAIGECRFMSRRFAMKKLFLTFAVFALLYGGTLDHQVQANPLMSKNTIVQGASDVQLTASKLKKMVDKFKKKFKKKRPVSEPVARYRTCGTNMYRDMRTGICIDRTCDGLMNRDKDTGKCVAISG